MMTGRVLITGATGFVGQALAADLAEAGVALTLSVRRATLPSSSPDVRVVEVGNIHGATDWSEALNGVSSVVHLAGLAHASGFGEDDYARVNRDGSVALYDAARKAGAAHLIFVSTITVLGEETTGRPFDDRSPADPRSAYARSKLAAEELLWARTQAGGPALTILRPPLVCGPGVKGNLAALLRLLDTPLPLPLGGIGNRRTLLPIDGLVAAIRLALATPQPTPATYVLGDRKPVSTTVIAEGLRIGLGRPRRLLPAPPGLLRGAAGLVGRRGAERRLLGDLEVDASGFRRAFGSFDTVDTRASLIATGAAWRSQDRRPAVEAGGEARLAG